MKVYRFDLASRRIATLSVGTGGGVYQVSYALSSRPYPVEFEDSADAGLPLMIRGQALTPPLDAIDSGAAVMLAGELRTILLTRSVDPESLDATVSMIAGELRALLLTHVIDPESLDSTVSMISGTLKAVLITNTMAPEELDAGAPTITAGTLT